MVIFHCYVSSPEGKPQKHYSNFTAILGNSQLLHWLAAEDIRLVIKDGKEEEFFFHHGEGIFSWVSGETLQGWVSRCCVELC